MQIQLKSENNVYMHQFIYFYSRRRIISRRKQTVKRSTFVQDLLRIKLAFLPCGHLVCCADCAPAMRKCPICRGYVKGTVKTFLA